ncbi:cellulase family glycosylhydrolase [Alsobacter sp. KACC 23698]|uniref:Cellulase family glycosylhydrolase n=1 Tax=Alsobacter sp. KACC 23698 TaxID=3149229 RepID=A0AAU7JJ68_9HYPH
MTQAAIRVAAEGRAGEPQRLTRRAALGSMLAAAAAVAGARTGPALAAAPRGPMALARGVNLSHWFAQSFEGYSATHLALFVKPQDLARLRAAGFAHARLNLDPDVMFPSGTALDATALTLLNRALDAIDAAGLATVVDLHPGSGKEKLAESAGQAQFVERWSRLARALAGRDPARLALEILNEPEPLRDDAWWALQERALAAIRAADQSRTVIVAGGGWSGIDDLVKRTPYGDPNLVYTVHYYAPILFTHQAAEWTWPVATRVSGLGWPEDAARAEAAAQAATRDQEAHDHVRDQIGGGAFTQSAMAASFDTLGDWARRHGDPAIYVGEFGAYARAAPRDARLRWVEAARREFERRGWGWAVWDSSRSFGLRPESGPDALDPGMLAALGLEAGR